MNKMKKLIPTLLIAIVAAVVLTGCVAIPPLINVQHKGEDSLTVKKLDAIEKRLDRLEEKLDKKP
jgi:starvation-inducible outer membrane lipoprotein